MSVRLISVQSAPLTVCLSSLQRTSILTVDVVLEDGIVKKYSDFIDTLKGVTVVEPCGVTTPVRRFRCCFKDYFILFFTHIQHRSTLLSSELDSTLRMIV
jgi:hypothetical protein